MSTGRSKVREMVYDQATDQDKRAQTELARGRREAGRTERIFVGWTTPILPSPNGKQLLQMTSTAMNSTPPQIQCGERPLKLNEL